MDPHHAVVEPELHGAQGTYGPHVLTDEDDGESLLGDIVHLPGALLLESDVAHGKHLVEDQDLRVEVAGNSEREARLHAARVALDRRVTDGPAPVQDA